MTLASSVCSVRVQPGHALRRRCAMPALLLIAAHLASPLSAATPRVHAIVGARVVTEPGKVIENGTVVLRDGLVRAVGRTVRVPPDARIWPGEGLTVYPGLIEPFAVRGGSVSGSPDSAAPAAGAAHALSTVTPERSIAGEDALDVKQRDELRSAGFTSAQVVPEHGIFRGQGALVALGDGPSNANLVRPVTAQVISLETARGTYPGSAMGTAAVIRQTFLDARWYGAAKAAHAKARGAVERPEHNRALEALQKVIDGTQPVIWRADDMLEAQRAAELSHELNLKPVVVGFGDEYKRAGTFAKAGVTFILPVAFPDAPDVGDPGDALEVTTATLRHWQNAPANAAVLDGKGVELAFTSDRLEKVKQFRERIGEAVSRGLSADAALAAVTSVPARLLGVADQLGTIAPGKIANLTVTSGDLFAKGSEVRAVWIDGNHYEVEPAGDGVAGTWILAMTGGEPSTLTVKAGRDTSATLISGADTLTAGSVLVTAADLRFRVSRGDRSASYELRLRRGRLSGTRSVETGSGAGSRNDVRGTRAPAGQADAAEQPEPVPAAEVAGDSEAWRAQKPEQPAVVLVRNATIWTAGPQGTLQGADLLVRRGKIAAVGRGLKAPAGAVVIDGTGRHVSPGIIDEHSHAAIVGGVNECTNVNTSEVRIEDVVNAESVHIYRQLAGGVTVMHLMHGSCNAIGGQCAAIKNRWGATKDELLVSDIPPTIKFALGENVKGSNSTGQRWARFPQSRGGVEQVYRDAFQSALDYRASWQEFRSGTRTLPPRRDLQKEALLEILDGTRLVHCHSYRQDEILMLIRVAENFGFTINTFTHILEGYKVADEIAAHGAGASAFSDWWAYKFEVYDAIPYNGYIMWDRGVTVAYNSDSQELARRLHTEAAKAVKYGGVPREEAIRFVTLNPAKLLKIDHRVGSLEPGKDADFAVWSGTPLSPYSHCEQTWIDGRRYFDRTEDLAGRSALAAERGALIARARLAAKRGGEGAGAGQPAFEYLMDSDRRGNDCGSEGEDAWNGGAGESGVR